MQPPSSPSVAPRSPAAHRGPRPGPPTTSASTSWPACWAWRPRRPRSAARRPRRPGRGRRRRPARCRAGQLPAGHAGRGPPAAGEEADLDDGDDAPSPFTAALARMVAGDRDVQHAVREALETAERPHPGPEPEPEPELGAGRTKQPAVWSRATRQKEETVGDQVIAPPSTSVDERTGSPSWADELSFARVVRGRVVASSRTPGSPSRSCAGPSSAMPSCASPRSTSPSRRSSPHRVLRVRRVLRGRERRGGMPAAEPAELSWTSRPWTASP